jgi:hypothetical protein
MNIKRFLIVLLAIAIVVFWAYLLMKASSEISKDHQNYNVLGAPEHLSVKTVEDNVVLYWSYKGDSNGFIVYGYDTVANTYREIEKIDLDTTNIGGSYQFPIDSSLGIDTYEVRMFYVYVPEGSTQIILNQSSLSNSIKIPRMSI